MNPPPPVFPVQIENEENSNQGKYWFNELKIVDDVLFLAHVKFTDKI